MANYSYLTFKILVSVIEVESALSRINEIWFGGQLKIERNDEDINDTIWWLHTDDVIENQLMPMALDNGLPLSFQIWLSKTDRHRITYKPNISFGIPAIIEEFVAMQLQKILKNNTILVKYHMTYKKGDRNGT